MKVAYWLVADVLAPREPAMPPPKLAAIRHWLRTMPRRCGIIFVDHGVGALSWSR
ncbi:MULTISPECIES: hypothetical protein [unclassified Bradyrhizobium]|uniref:hypothetical protein n=1 Tax=unclassified Bradyrhizobium TaxID=2631580 RepID=UPI00230469E7|nr:hypothetical protein [Bradyrhizobium sp. CCBAU 45321]